MLRRGLRTLSADTVADSTPSIEKRASEAAPAIEPVESGSATSGAAGVPRPNRIAAMITTTISGSAFSRLVSSCTNPAVRAPRAFTSARIQTIAMALSGAATCPPSAGTMWLKLLTAAMPSVAFAIHIDTM